VTTETRSGHVLDTDRPRHTQWLPCLLLALAAVLVAVVHIPQHDKISPIDEYAYIDYVAKVPDQLVVRQGEATGDFSRRYLLCHGVAVFPNYNPDVVGCTAAGSTVNDDGFPHGGHVTTDIYTPLYFVTAWTVSKALSPFGVDLVDGARASGALWLALAAILLYLGAIRLGANRPTAGALSLLMVASPMAFWSNTYVSTDGTVLFAGALMLFVGVGVVQGRHGPLPFAAAATLVMLLKLQNFIAVGALVLVFALILLSRVRNAEDRKSLIGDRLLKAGVLAVLFAVLAEGVWLAIRAALSVGPTPDQGVSSPWSPLRVLIDATAFFPNSVDIVNTAADPGQLLVVWLMKLVVVGGVAAAVLRPGKLDLVGQVALSSFVMAVLSGPVLATLFQVFSGTYVVPVTRYGAALTPLYLAVAAVVLTRWLAREEAVGSSRRLLVGAAPLVLSAGVYAIALTTYG
jgi:hypothetical protein